MPEENMQCGSSVTTAQNEGAYYLKPFSPKAGLWRAVQNYKTATGRKTKLSSEIVPLIQGKASFRCREEKEVKPREV
jgi:hypothetical protein